MRAGIMGNQESIGRVPLKEKLWWALFSILVVLCIALVVLFIIMGADMVLHFSLQSHNKNERLRRKAWQIEVLQTRIQG